MSKTDTLTGIKVCSRTVVECFKNYIIIEEELMLSTNSLFSQNTLSLTRRIQLLQLSLMLLVSVFELTAFGLFQRRGFFTYVILQLHLLSLRNMFVFT